MSEEPGKYDDVCTFVRDLTFAQGAVLLILGGEHGNGFSVQCPKESLMQLPAIFREVADQIEAQAQNLRKAGA